MATLATRLTSTGNLLVNGTFDEVSMPSGSLLFDGNGDYLTLADNSGFEFGSGDFTIESYINFNSFAGPTSNVVQLFGQWSGIGDKYSLVFLITPSEINLAIRNTGLTFISHISPTSLTTNKWYHIATSRSGSNLRIFVDGVQAGITHNIGSNVIISTPTNNFLIGYKEDTVQYLNGYISNLRVVKGTALYTANFTPSIGILESTANTSLLLNVLNSTDFIKDNSRNNFSLARNGDVAYNSLTPFNRGAHSVSSDTVFTRLSDEVSLAAGSILLDGTGDYLEITNNAVFDFGSGNFTIETYINFLAAPSSAIEYQIWHPINHASGFRRISWYIYTNIIQIAYFGTVIASSSSLTWTLGTWYNLAVTRSGNTYTLWRDGVSVGTGTNTNTLDSASGYRIGNNINGYFSNFRVTKGSALYTANFTHQQTILDSTANTSLLLNVLNSTDFKKDNSQNNFNLTANGNATWNVFGPFNQGVTGLAERRLNNGTLIKGEFDEYSGIDRFQYIGNTTSAVIPDSNSFSVDYPAGTQDGDLAIIAISATNNLGNPYLCTGWTTIDRQVVQTGVRSQLSYRIVSGTSTQTFAKTGVVTVFPAYTLLVFRNLNYSSYAFANNSTASPDSPSLTGTFNCVVSFGFTAATDTTVDPPTGYVSANNVSNTASLMSAYSISNQTNPDPGSFQNVTSGAWHAYTVGLF